MTDVNFARIGELCQVGDGTHSKVPRQESGILYLTSRNFKDGGLDLSSVYYISEEDFDKHFGGNGKALAKPEYGDLVFSIIGTIGEPYLVRRGDKFGLSSSVAVVRPDRTVIDPEFLFYWFKGPKFQQALFGIKGGVAQGYVSLEMIRSLPVPQLPLPVQRRIAGILSAYDELIENNKRRIKILEEMARSLYREWFVNFRFPGHEKVPFVDSPLGPIPKGWEVKKLGEVADVSWGDTATTKASYVDQGYQAFSATGNDGKLDHYDFDRPGIVLSAIGANCGRTWFAQGKWSCIKNTIRFWAINDIVSTEYLFFATWDHAFWPRRGAAQPFISQGDAKQTQILRADSSLMTAFTKLAENVLRQTDILDRQSSNLRCTRDLLLPRLLSGDLAVSVPCI